MDYVTLFKTYQLPVDFSRLGKYWINTTCPYCGSNGSTHLGIHVLDDYCTCFKCGGHNLRNTLIKLLNIPADLFDVTLQPFQTKTHYLHRLNKKQAVNQLQIKLPGNDLSTREKNYLLSRHFSPKQLINDFNIQGGGYVGPWKNRIIIPIYLAGKLVTWTSRTIIKDREPRYKNLENEKSVVDPKKIFFNLDNCYLNTVALLEGPFDVMRFGNNGICGFGISLTNEQVVYLSERFDKIYILFDSERAAQKKAKEYAMRLQGQRCQTFIVDAFSDYGCKDAGEMSPYNINKLKKELGL